MIYKYQKMAKLSLDDFKGKEEEVKKDFPENINKI